MKCIRLRVRVTVGVNVGVLGLSVSVVVLLLLLLLLFVCFCVMGLCESGGDSFMYVSFICMFGVPGVNCGDGMLLGCWCRLWPCIIGVCSCSVDSLLCVGGGGEGVGIGAGSHHSSDVGVVVGDGVGIGAGSHQSSGVGVMVGDGVGIGAGSHQSSDLGVSGVLLCLCAVLPSFVRPAVKAVMMALLIGMGDGGVGAV